MICWRSSTAENQPSCYSIQVPQRLTHRLNPEWPSAERGHPTLSCQVHHLARGILNTTGRFPLATAVHQHFQAKLEFRAAAISVHFIYVSAFISAFNVFCSQCAADDSLLYTSTKILSSDVICNLSNCCANAVTRWHLENNMLLNPTNTEPG